MFDMKESQVVLIWISNNRIMYQVEYVNKKLTLNKNKMSINNLINKEAKDKLKEMIDSIDFAMLQTNLKFSPAHTIPMSTKKVDEDGNIWFLSNRTSEHNKHIEDEGLVQLIYSKPSSMEFLTVYGEASISLNMQDIDRLYTKMDDAWFEGKEDPNLSAIKVNPVSCHYWDTKDNKIVTLFKMGLSMITGNKQDLGEQGNLQI